MLGRTRNVLLSTAVAGFTFYNQQQVDCFFQSKESAIQKECKRLDVTDVTYKQTIEKDEKFWNETKEKFEIANVLMDSKCATLYKIWHISSLRLIGSIKSQTQVQNFDEWDRVFDVLNDCIEGDPELVKKTEKFGENLPDF